MNKTKIPKLKMMKTNTLLIEKLSFKELDPKTIIELTLTNYVFKCEDNECLSEKDLVHLDRLQFEN